jgi:hypothetical protein
MAAQKHATGSLSAHGSNCSAEALLVAVRATGVRWPVRSQLAKGEIAAQDSRSRGAKGVTYREKKRRVAVRSCAVRQDEAVPIRFTRDVQEPLNWYLVLRDVPKLSIGVHITAHCSQWFDRLRLAGTGFARIVPYPHEAPSWLISFG